MISVVLVLCAVITGFLALGCAMSFERDEKSISAGMMFVLLVCTLALSFIAGVLS